MAKKNSHTDKEELWSKRFDENSDYSDGNLSRSARKKAEKGIPPILTTTIIFLIALIILPVGAYIWWSNDPAPSTAESARAEESIQVSKNSTSIQPQASNEEEEPEKEEEPEDAESETTPEEQEEEPKEETTSSEPEETETEPVVEEPVEESAPEPVEQPVEEPVETPVVEEEPETSYGTYTVKQGDNLYRIALNHGMTTDELKQLNGIASDEVQVGTVLRVE